MACDGIHDKEMLYNSGVLVEHCDGAALPPADLWQRKRGGYVVIECPQRIPCNPFAPPAYISQLFLRMIESELLLDSSSSTMLLFSE